MVIAKLYGGLGNQMFQYAAGLGLAQRLQTPLYVDTIWFDARAHPPESPPTRAYELAAFGIEPGVPLRVRLKARLRKPTYFAETAFGYQSEIELLQGDVILDGYWQSYKYFAGIDGAVRATFGLPPPSSHVGRSLAARVAVGETVAVHMRRGDYVSNEKVARKLGALPSSYYEQAARAVGSRAGRCDFFVFSDDIDWVRGNVELPAARSVTHVEGTDDAVEDLALMARCRHQIVANSSFSWWGAWLATHPEQIVVAPARWFNDPPVDTRDLLPDHWVRV